LEVGWYSFPDLERLPLIEAGDAEGDRVLLPPIIVEG
jgi:hypothetical protein